MSRSAPRGREPVRTLSISEPEAWLLDEVVRHTFTEDGQPLGRDLLLKVFSVLRELRASANRPFAARELPLSVTESECWLIDYHVNAARLQRADPATARAARELLHKVFDLVLAFQAERALGGEAMATTTADDAFAILHRERLAEWQRAQERIDGRDEEPHRNSACSWGTGHSLARN